MRHAPFWLRFLEHPVGQAGHAAVRLPAGDGTGSVFLHFQVTWVLDAAGQGGQQQDAEGEAGHG